jgi:hypothetical protein
MPSDPPLCSFKQECKDDLGISLQLDNKTFWCRKYSGSIAEEFLLAEALTRCSQVHKILHCLHHFQGCHQETRVMQPSTYSR